MFAATAGVREALVTRTQALRRYSPPRRRLTKTIAASANWNAVSTALESASLGGVPVSNLTAGQITEITSQLHADFDHGAVSLAPAEHRLGVADHGSEPGAVRAARRRQHPGASSS